jgi:hypothetical protein
MANSEHVELVMQGAEAIREWRKANPFGQLALRQANLAEARLSGADLRWADLREAKLSGAILTRTLLLRADLSGADLNGADLRWANLHLADLQEAALERANLSTAYIHEANLQGANLSQANLCQANLSGAKLNEANLCRTLLLHADLGGADLGQADLTSAYCFRTQFVNVNLSDARGLATVKHAGPSTVDIDTLYTSKGQIPTEFLKGCGVPDGLVNYLPSLLNSAEPIQFYSCLLSHSREDQEFCDTLYSRMADKKLRVWYAPQDAQGGEYLRSQIGDAIHLHDKLLIVLSESSIGSDWIKRQVRTAIERERRDQTRILFPVGLLRAGVIRGLRWYDEELGINLAEEICKYDIPDFRRWKDHDVFETEFGKLLEALCAE